MKITDHSFIIFSVVMFGMESDVLVSVDLLQFQIENLRRFQHCLLQFIFFSCLDRSTLRESTAACVYVWLCWCVSRQVLDSSKNWWKVQNHTDATGFVPNTILKPLPVD